MRVLASREDQGFLAELGATVIQASDGEAALALTLKEKPDLVTLDLSMPGKNGGYVFEEIRKNPAIASTKVCIITGKPELRRLIYERPVAPPEGYLDHHRIPGCKPLFS